MGTVRKQGAITLLLSYCGILVGLFNTFFLFTHFLSTEEIGLLNVLNGIVIMFCGFAELNASSIMSKFYPYYFRNPNKSKDLLLLAFSIALVGFITVVIVTTVFYDVIFRDFFLKSPLIKPYLWLVYPAMIFTLLSNILNTYCGLYLKNIIPSLIRDLCVKLWNTFILGLFAFHYIGINTVLITISLVQFLVCIGLIIYIIYIKRWIFSFAFSSVTKRLKKAILRFGIVNIVVLISELVITTLGGILLARYEGLSAAAVFTIANSLALIVIVPYNSISPIYRPLISQAIFDRDKDKVERLYRKTSLNLMLIMGIIFLIIWANIDSVYNLLPEGKGFEQGKFVFFWIACARWFDASMGANNEIVAFSKYYMYTIYTRGFSAIIAIVSTWYFTKEYGLNGVSVSTFITFFIFNAVYAVVVYRKFKIQPFTIQSCKAFLLLMLGFFIFAYCIHFNFIFFNNRIIDSLFNMSILSLLIVFYFILGVYFFKISDDINEFIDKCVKLFICKFQT